MSPTSRRRRRQLPPSNRHLVESALLRNRRHRWPSVWLAHPRRLQIRWALTTAAAPRWTYGHRRPCRRYSSWSLTAAVRQLRADPYDAGCPTKLELPCRPVTFTTVWIHQRKGQRHITLEPHTAAAATLSCHRQSGRTAHRLTYDQPAIRSPGLPFNGLHPCNPCNYMDIYSFTDPGEMEGWVGLVGWPIADILPAKWSHVNHRSCIDQWKFASQRPTS